MQEGKKRKGEKEEKIVCANYIFWSLAWWCDLYAFWPDDIIL